MSVHEFILELAPLAKRDLRAIVNYTEKTWGGRQAAVYYNKIRKALNLIAENPYRGKKGYSGRFIFLAEKHKIFYRITGKTIIVIRILHQRMDAGSHLR